MMATTLDQLPKCAADYYAESLRSGVFDFEEIDRDDARRRVVQRYFNGQKRGYPIALLTFTEFKANVQRLQAEAPHTPIGVSRWTRPYYRDDSRVGPLSASEDCD